MRRYGWLIAAVVLVAVGVVGLSVQGNRSGPASGLRASDPAAGPYGGPMMGGYNGPYGGGMMGGYGGQYGGPMMGGYPATASSDFSSNGERIYYTATDADGNVIPFRGGPMWLSMHGGSCVSCHGADGRGGYVPMANVKAPDIQYKALTSEHHEMEEGGHKEEHPPYTDATIKRAIRDGLDPAGHRLNLVMPRWQMSDKDANAVIAYLKTLGQEQAPAR